MSVQKKLSHINARKPGKKASLPECRDCPALCCHDLSVEILKPSNRKEIEDLMWHLNYDTVGVYILNRRWHLIIKGRCQYLDGNNLCVIYKNRFSTCRKHRPPDCEKFSDWYDVIFRTPFELEEYLRKEKLRWQRNSQKRAGRKAAPRKARKKGN